MSRQTDLEDRICEYETIARTSSDWSEQKAHARHIVQEQWANIESDK